MKVSLSAVQPGMVLAAPVLGPGGRQLADAGTVITDQHLKVMRVWGIDAVAVVGTDRVPVSDAILQAAQRQVAPLFRGQPVEHPVVRALFAVAVERAMRRQP